MTKKLSRSTSVTDMMKKGKVEHTPESLLKGVFTAIFPITLLSLLFGTGVYFINRTVTNTWANDLAIISWGSAALLSAALILLLVFFMSLVSAISKGLK